MELNPTTVAVGAYVAWLVAVVLLLAGWYTPFPLLPGVRPGVVAGTVVFFLVGVLDLGRRARGRLAGGSD